MILVVVAPGPYGLPLSPEARTGAIKIKAVRRAERYRGDRHVRTPADHHRDLSNAGFGCTDRPAGLTRPTASVERSITLLSL